MSEHTFEDQQPAVADPSQDEESLIERGGVDADGPASGPGTGELGAEGTPEKDPEQWVTGDEPLTGPQASYLRTLAHEAGEQVPEGLTKAQASELIDELQERTGRGR